MAKVTIIREGKYMDLLTLKPGDRFYVEEGKVLVEGYTEDAIEYTMISAQHNRMSGCVFCQAKYKGGLKTFLLKV